MLAVFSSQRRCVATFSSAADTVRSGTLGTRTVSLLKGTHIMARRAGGDRGAPEKQPHTSVKPRWLRCGVPTVQVAVHGIHRYAYLPTAGSAYLDCTRGASGRGLAPSPAVQGHNGSTSDCNACRA